MSENEEFTLDSFVQHRKKFTPEEDERLKELVERFGSSNWHQIAQEMPGRSGRQCRCRYNNYLVPGFVSGKFSPEEDELLYQLVRTHGHRWTLISTHFNGRSAGILKNRWNFGLSQEIKRRKFKKSSQKVNRMVNSDFTLSSQRLSKSQTLQKSQEPQQNNTLTVHSNNTVCAQQNTSTQSQPAQDSRIQSNTNSLNQNSSKTNVEEIDVLPKSMAAIIDEFNRKENIANFGKEEKNLKKITGRKCNDEIITFCDYSFEINGNDYFEI